MAYLELSLQKVALGTHGALSVQNFGSILGPEKACVPRAHPENTSSIQWVNHEGARQVSLKCPGSRIYRTGKTAERRCRAAPATSSPQRLWRL